MTVETERVDIGKEHTSVVEHYLIIMIQLGGFHVICPIAISTGYIQHTVFHLHIVEAVFLTHQLCPFAALELIFEKY